MASQPQTAGCSASSGELNRFTFSRNFPLIQAVMTHPRLWPWVASDDAGAAETFAPNENWLYILVHDTRDGALLGLFAVVPMDRQTCALHTCLLPLAWGGRARSIYREGLAWLSAHSDFRRVRGYIRTANKLALRLALGAGLEVLGIERGGARKNGFFIDQWIVGKEI